MEMEEKRQKEMEKDQLPKYWHYDRPSTADRQC